MRDLAAFLASAERAVPDHVAQAGAQLSVPHLLSAAAAAAVLLDAQHEGLA